MFFRISRRAYTSGFASSSMLGRRSISTVSSRVAPTSSPWRLSGYTVREGNELWLDLSEVEAKPLEGLASDPTIYSQLQQSKAEGLYLNLDRPQQSLEFWANASLAVGKFSRLRLTKQSPKLSEVFQRQSKRLPWSLKRLSDWGAAVILLLLLSPLLAILAALIKLTSPGPIFFRQWRVGQNGQLFRIFKFRTMTAGAERQHRLVMGQQQGLNKCENDPRVTSLGCLMRKSSLDELPQLLNVVAGQMSLVGPRPWALYDAVQIKPSDRHRLLALPGITGLWQVSARSKLLDIDRVTGLDLHYIQTWSLKNDLKILLKTFPSVIQGRGAC